MNILYLGDDAGTTANYLNDCFAELEHAVTHCDSRGLLPELAERFDTVVLSDYPASQLPDSAVDKLADWVRNSGTRLIMLGGWDSFNGRGTNYAGHPLAELLPVNLHPDDDRVNASQGLVIKPAANLAIDIPLDWPNPPIICGYNALEAKAESDVMVYMRPIKTDGDTIELLQPLPFVVKGKAGKGITVACATDLAPHWSGGLVDWGSERRALAHVEVGDSYIQFVRFLLEV